jgi:hypothetical protein
MCKEKYMERFKYSELLQFLSGFDPWLLEIGMTPRADDRIHQAFKVLRKAEEASSRGRATGVYSEIQPEDWFPIVEALEAYNIYTAFHQDSPPVPAETLKRAFSGPLQPMEENQKNRDGRNIWFELALAAEWKLRGASVSLGEPDLRLTRDGILFLVSCKRPASEEGIDANFRAAIKQLQANLDTVPVGTYGVAAISLNCIFNPGDKVFSGEMNQLKVLLDNEFAKREEYLLSINDPRICCVLFHLATPSLGEEIMDLIRASYTLAWDLDRPSIGSKIFREHAADMRTNARMR